MDSPEQIKEAIQLAAMIGGGVLVVAFAIMAAVKRLLYVCPPNKVLIFSGRNRVTEDGRRVGFRTVFGGRAWRMPFLESVQEMDLTNISVPMSITGAYSEGTEGTLGIPLSVHAVANVKVSSNPKFILNAIERFLGRGRDEITHVSKETLEGHLRGVLATMTPEEVNEDRLKFAQRLTEEAGSDLAKLGLHLDTLKVQQVSDDRNYLESIGRTRIAEVVRAAEVAESDAQRTAKEAEAAAGARAQVARTKAEANILRKRNELREVRAELEAEAKSEEERAIAAAEQARQSAERELQEVRGDLEQLRLAAEVTIPAEIAREVKELEAAGRAATIAEDGRASAEALAAVAEAWAETKGQALDMYVLQNLEDILGGVVRAAKQLKVREVNLVDSGDGKTLPAYASAYPATVSALLDQVTSSLGVDIKAILAKSSPNDTLLPEPTAPNPPTPTTGGRSW